MKMIWQKSPSINLNISLFSEEPKSGKEIVSVLIGQEDGPFLDPSTYHMMEDTRSV